MTLSRVLVANRGEIALRIVRACRDAGIESVAVHGNDDAEAPYVRLADAAVHLGGTGAQAYLDVAALLAAARDTAADSVHPGYGFLAESADFAQAVTDAGLTWIGPPPEVIRALGDKVRARAIAASVGAPLAAGSDGPVQDADEAVAFAREHGLPVAIKATHGGGGRGMRIARTLDEVPALFDSAVREATAAFGRGECFVEAYVERGRHVEAQVLADTHGGIAVLGTRDCTLQRRYQKLVEEAPAPWLTDVTRKDIERCAADICRAAGYVNAATVEFLLSSAGELSFLEVNTRLQVEHPVTEESLGIDVVRAQLAIAAGADLAEAVGTVPEPSRHALEFRINAEDPAQGFTPSVGTISGLRLPTGPGVRVDAGVETGSVVSGRFDSLLAKLVVSGRDRRQALERARRALDEFHVDGVRTTLPFCRDVVRAAAFVGDDGGLRIHTRWIEDEYTPSGEAPDEQPAVRVGTRWLPVGLPGLDAVPETRLRQVRAQLRERAHREAAAAGDVITSPMQGTVVAVLAADGDVVSAGQAVAVVEAMKMENRLVAPHDGRVTGLAVAVGDTLPQGGAVCRVEAGG